MTNPTPYPGYCPANVNKDAKYTVKSKNGEWSVHLVYTVSAGVRELLTSTDHPALVDMVNAVKHQKNGVNGGAFYINEFGHVIVPADGRHFYAGSYHTELRFDFEDAFISPKAPDWLKPGDDWPGPHVGIRYTMSADANDIYYERKLTETRTERVQLSREVGSRSAARLAGRLAGNIKQRGGRIYINEQCEFFSPLPEPSGSTRYVYLGHLDDDDWFPEVDV